MKLSLITSCFNSQATIRATLDSVRAQNYAPIEYIIVDGGSTDGTLSILDEYSDIISKQVSEPDEGIYDALNKGIRLASGDVVGFIHSDDMLASSLSLHRLMEVFKNGNVDAVYADLDYVDRDKPEKVIRRWRSDSFREDRFYNGWMPAHPTFYLKREHYENLGGYRTDMRISADYELMLRMLLKHKLTAVYIPEVLIKMRVGGESNVSLKNRMQANKEDRRAWTVNDMKPRFYTSLMKPLSKLKQFI